MGRHTPRLLVNRERVGERGTAGGRGLGRPFDFERAHAHSNDVLYQVSSPGPNPHTLPLLYPFTLSHSNDVLYQGDCDAGVRELAASLGWQHELERLCSQAGAVHRAPPPRRD